MMNVPLMRKNIVVILFEEVIAGVFVDFREFMTNNF